MLKIAFKTLLWLALIYAGVLAGVSLYDHWSLRSEDIDTYRDYPGSIYADSNHLLTYGLDRIVMHDKQVLIIGASVSGYGYDLAAFKAALPAGWHVHKLSMAGANITMYRQLLDDMKTLGLLDIPSELVIVLDGHFITMLDDARKFGGTLTHLDKDKLRHKVFAAGENGLPSPRFEQPLQDLVRYTLVKPFVLLYGLQIKAHQLAEKIKTGALETLGMEARPSLERYKERRLDMFDGLGYGAEQLERLKALLKDYAAPSRRFVWIDLPLMSQYREGFKPVEDYHREIGPILKTLDMHYAGIETFAPDDQFDDDIHPKAEFKPAWSEKVAGIVASVITAQP